MNSDFFKDVYLVVRLIPKGRVTSYGAIAKYLGTAKSARVVGWAMNNSHFDKSIPQELDSKLFVKSVGEKEVKIEEINEEIKSTKKVIKERTQVLKSKKADLDLLSNESKEEEKKLDSLKTKASKKIEPSLLLSYEKLVNRQRNGLAVVKVSRGACGGCFNVVPPQRHA